MSRIVVGHFQHAEQRDEALAALARAGFSPDEYGWFYLNPPGQHGLRMLGGDSASDEGASESGKGAGTAAAIGGAAGLAVGSLGGPIGALAGAGVGAYIGSLAGALGRTHHPHVHEGTVQHPVEPPAGPAISVCVDRPGSEQTAIEILKAANARQIERGNGIWADGEWQDYDPREPMDIVSRQDSVPPPRPADAD